MWGLVLLTMAVLYTIGIVWSYYNLYEFEQEKKWIYIIGGNFIMLLFTFLFLLINKVEIGNEVAQNTVDLANLLTFAPFHSLVLLPQIARVINQAKGKRIEKNTAEKRIILWLILFCIILFFEIGYIKDFGRMIESMSQNQIS